MSTESWQKDTEDANRLDLFHTIELLKTRKRTGWVRQGIQNSESIADHMYRMAMLAILSDQEDKDVLDISKCVLLAVVHDFAESTVGDITPDDGIPKHKKQELENTAMHQFCTKNLEPGSVPSKRLKSLWEEYEAQETNEAKFVKDLDWFELALQATEYEKAQDARGLHSFFVTTIPKIRHPEIRKWAHTLMEERRSIWIQKGLQDQYIHVSPASS